MCAKKCQKLAERSMWRWHRMSSRGWAFLQGEHTISYIDPHVELPQNGNLYKTLS